MMDTMAGKKKGKKVLVIDVGGTNIKMLATGVEERIKIPSGKDMSAQEMVDKVITAIEEAGWEYEVISLGVPCVVRDERVRREPVNLGTGWVDFDFANAFDCPVKLINDAAIQAYGCYKGGTMLFLGFGTGLGTALIVDGTIIPLEAGHLPYKKTKKSLEDYTGKAGRERLGDKKWLKHSLRIIKSLRHSFCATDLVIGGGNAADLDPFPEYARQEDNSAAFTGGFRLWEKKAK
jgi:predicted NBD/HSP70 family sugar kinase